MEESQLTIMAYLNEEFTGGHTNFLDDTPKPHTITHALEPKTGKATERILLIRLRNYMFFLFERNGFNISASTIS